MASALPTRIDLFDAVKADLKSKGKNFVWGKDLHDSTRSCLIELLRNQYDSLTADICAQIDVHTDRFCNKAPYFWQEAHRKRDNIVKKTLKHSEFWHTELTLSKPDPSPERSMTELVPYETASISTQNRRKRKLCEDNPSKLLKDGLIRQLRLEGDHAGADLLQQVVAPKEGQMRAPEILDLIHKKDRGEDNEVKVSTIRALAGKIGNYHIHLTNITLSGFSFNFLCHLTKSCQFYHHIFKSEISHFSINRVAKLCRI